MKCDVSSILKLTGSSIKVGGKVEMTEKSLSPSGPVFNDDIYFEGTITNIGSTLEFAGNVKGSFQALCARCAKELVEHFDFDFTEILSNREVNIEEEDDIVLFEGEIVDLSSLVESNILVNLSLKYLCNENCKGLCPICGADLNVTSCDCKSDLIDPRMAGLKKLLEEQ